MKYLSLLAFLLLFNIASFAQLVFKTEMEEPRVEGMCDYDNIYILMNEHPNQVEPKCKLLKEEMEEQLNQMLFLQRNPKFKGKGLIYSFINCEGEVILFEMTRSENIEFDKEVIKVFRTFTKWSAGKLNGKNVDSKKIFIYKIKRGKITLH